MKTIGIQLIIIGILIILLNLTNLIPKLLQWIYSWGAEIAWAIKIGIIILGLILWIFGQNKKINETYN